MTGKQAVAAAVCAVAALAAFVAWHASDARRVRRVFARAESILRQEAAEPPFASLSKAQVLYELLEPRVRVDGADFGHAVFDAETVKAHYAVFRRQSRATAVSFAQMTVTLDGDAAEVLCNATLRGFPGGGADASGADADARAVFALAATLRRNPANGAWRFAALRLTPVP